LKKQNALTLNDKKDVDSFVEQTIAKNAYELERNYVWPLILCLFILLQSVISSGSYSGAGQSPKFGDFEAQRHWMEITVNLPAGEW
jgi:alpha-1,3-glucosyltransferase